MKSPKAGRGILARHDQLQLKHMLDQLMKAVSNPFLQGLAVQPGKEHYSLV